MKDLRYLERILIVTRTGDATTLGWTRVLDPATIGAKIITNTISGVLILVVV